MKILLIGATGMVGSRIAAEAVSRGHDVIAATRKATPVEGATAVALDVADVDAMVDLAKDADVIASAASSREGDDIFAATGAYIQALIAGATKSGKRLVLVGGAGSLTLPDGTPVCDVVPELYRTEAQAMRKGYRVLEISDVDYSFVSPAGTILPGERTETFRVCGRAFPMDAEGNSAISAEDYAIGFVDEVESAAHPRQIMSLAY